MPYMIKQMQRSNLSGAIDQIDGSMDRPLRGNRGSILTCWVEICAGRQRGTCYVDLFAFNYGCWALTIDVS